MDQKDFPGIDEHIVKTPHALFPPYMQNAFRIIILPPHSLFSYKEKARTNPPSTASPPFAKFALAALVLVVLEGVAPLDVEAGVEAVVPAPVVRAVVKVEESVTFELGDGVGKLEVMFALVDVETTVTVDEGTEEVEVLVATYDGPVDSLMVVVEPAVADEVDPDPLIWNG